jgi:hypothetical protein
MEAIFLLVLSYMAKLIIRQHYPFINYKYCIIVNASWTFRCGTLHQCLTLKRARLSARHEYLLNNFLRLAYNNNTTYFLKGTTQNT